MFVACVRHLKPPSVCYPAVYIDSRMWLCRAGLLDACVYSLRELRTRYKKTCRICKQGPFAPEEELGPDGESHKDCYNARQCAYRMGRKDSRIKAALKTLKTTNDEEYQAVIFCLNAMDGARSQIQRTDARVFMIEMGSEVSSAKRTGFLMLTRRQFIAWHRVKEMMSQSEAEQHWEDRRSWFFNSHLTYVHLFMSLASGGVEGKWMI